MKDYVMRIRSWTVTHPGRRHLGQLPPQTVAQIKPGQSLCACRFTLISYQASIRRAGVPASSEVIRRLLKRG